MPVGKSSVARAATANRQAPKSAPQAAAESEKVRAPETVASQAVPEKPAPASAARKPAAVAVRRICTIVSVGEELPVYLL